MLSRLPNRRLGTKASNPSTLLRRRTQEDVDHLREGRRFDDVEAVRLCCRRPIARFRKFTKYDDFRWTVDSGSIFDNQAAWEEA